MLDNIAFAIPSYKRCGKIATLNMLEAYGIPKEYIYLSTQTNEDYEKYKQLYSQRANVLYKEAHNCAGNRNNAFILLREKYRYILMMDDDVSSVQRIVKETRKGKASNYRSKTIKVTGGDESAREFLDVIERHAKIIDNGATLVSAYGGSPLNLINKKQLKVKNGFGRGTWLFLSNKSPLFNEEMDCCDDVELSLRIFAEGGSALVDESLVVNTMSMAETTCNENAGGCAEVYCSSDDAILNIQKKYILEPYNGLVKINKVNGGENGSRYYSLSLAVN